MIEMTGVVADLVDVRCDDFSQAIILLQIDHQIRFGLFADFRQCSRVFRAVNRDANHVSTCRKQILDLTDRRIDILSLCRCHALNGNGMSVSNCRRTNFDRPSCVSSKIHLSLPWCRTVITRIRILVGDRSMVYRWACVDERGRHFYATRRSGLARSSKFRASIRASFL